MKLTDIRLEPMSTEYDAAIAKIIRSSLEEFGANKPGTVYYDKETDHLTRLFDHPRAYYFMALHEGRLLGGAGIFPTAGLEENMAELVKMYLLPEARGIGLGKKLLEACFEKAREMGYTTLYIETLPELRQAISLYRHMGFEEIPAQLGNSNHGGCSVFMVRTIT